MEAFSCELLFLPFLYSTSHIALKGGAAKDMVIIDNKVVVVNVEAREGWEERVESDARRGRHRVSSGDLSSTDE